jgi:hypothetical protein
MPDRTTDRLLSATIGPIRFPIQSWYEALIRCHKARGSRVFVVESIEHHKQPWKNLHDEFLLLRVAPLGVDEEASSIIIGRTFEDPYEFVPPPLLGIQGTAIDLVTILPRGSDDVTSQQPLSSISWSRSSGCAPPLVDLTRMFCHISIVQPYFNIFTTQCCWFARAAYWVTGAVYCYGHVSEHEWDKHWNLSPVLRIGTLSRTTLMTSHPTYEALKTIIVYHTCVGPGLMESGVDGPGEARKVR